MAMGGKEAGLLGIAIAAVLLSSGCISLIEGANAQNDPSQTGNGKSDEAPGHAGDLLGTVSDENSLPIEGANIALIGTDLFRVSDATGRFEFLGIPEGIYTMRVDAAGYLSLQTDVQVQKKMVTRVAITLASVGCRPHFHDYWGDQNTIVLADMDLNLNFGSAVNVVTSGVLDPNLGGPDRAFFLPDGTFVYPGTANMTVIFSWDPSETNGLSKVGFAYSTASGGNFTPPRRLAPQSNGEARTFRVADFESDSGHSKGTRWHFAYYLPGGQNTVAFGTLHVKLVIAKRVVPLEACGPLHTN